MLDRIASFTNGMLTYNNTMEHLNLLDADFYFAITDSILSQDVAATLLMLDNAMEKGFEGDVVIEGLAEHYRNLLLCKDIRMARLLDVPNEHKPVYLEKANQLPPSFILSALNVLNQCELEYKNATNRRLHVEMCLIRLCYLQSTINGLQLATADTEKKNSDQLTPPPAAPRQAPPPVAVPMQQQAPPPAATYPAEHMYSQPQTQFVAEPAAPVMPTGNPPTEPAVPAAASTRPARPANAGRRLTRDLLDMSEQNAGPAKEKKELTVGLAEELFKAFLAKLKAENKDSVAAQLDLTRREVFLPDEVKIIAPTKLAETILLNQRSLIQEFFQEQTNNAIRITNELIEDVSMVEAQRSVLSKSEQFEALVMKNPLLGMLRDSLGMQIEY
jgi:DNA polymerase-3 subunit gamma/tau